MGYIRLYLIRLVLTLLLAFLVFGAPLLMKCSTKGFHLARFEFDHDWSAVEKAGGLLDPSEEKAALKILSQSFTYLNRGAQCYVFGSKDDRYVIKIFQENRSVTPLSRWKQKNKQKKMRIRGVKKSSIDFLPCLTAYSMAKEETALVYMHLFPTNGRLPKLSIRSPLGGRFLLSLDRYSFVIQKKVRPFQESLLQASLEGNLSQYLTSFFSLLQSRASKGIRNNDTSLSSNFGFLGAQAVEIDFGRYVQSDRFLDPDMQKAERDIFICKLRAFMEKHLPCEISTLETVLSQQNWSSS